MPFDGHGERDPLDSQDVSLQRSAQRPCKRSQQNRSHSLIHVQHLSSKQSQEWDENEVMPAPGKSDFRERSTALHSRNRTGIEDVYSQIPKMPENKGQLWQSDLSSPILNTLDNRPEILGRVGPKYKSAFIQEGVKDASQDEMRYLDSRFDKSKLTALPRHGVGAQIPTKQVAFNVNQQKVRLLFKREEVVNEPDDMSSDVESLRDKDNMVNISFNSQLNRTLLSSFKEEGSVRHSQASKTYDAVGNLRVNQYEFLNLIGRGTFGKVYKVRDTKDKKLYVVFFITRQ